MAASWYDRGSQETQKILAERNRKANPQRTSPDGRAMTPILGMLSGGGLPANIQAKLPPEAAQMLAQFGSSNPLFNSMGGFNLGNLLGMFGGGRPATPPAAAPAAAPPARPTPISTVSKMPPEAWAELQRKFGLVP